MPSPLIDALNAHYDVIAEPTGLEIKRLAKAKGLPHLARAVRSLKAASAYLPEQNLRHYLYDSVQNGGFDIESPLDGRPARSQYSIALADKTTFVFFRGFVIGIGHLGRGYPIAALILPAQRLFIHLVDSVWAVRPQQLEMVAALLAKYGTADRAEPAGLTLLSGDPNYAHHVWNQLPALESIAAVCDLRRDVELFSTHEPLGATTRIFPELSKWRNRRVAGWELERINAQRRLTLPVGSSFIPASLIARLMRDFRRQTPPEHLRELLHAMREARGNVLWMSIRTRNRTATNLFDALVQIGCDFLELEPGGIVVLDGHSLASDFKENPGYDKPAQEAVVENDLREAQAIRDAIEAKSQRPGSVRLAIGLSISDSLQAAPLVGVYFCHHGTVQHKVGWFSSAPGVVHCNRRIALTNPAEYIAQQSEVGMPPLYVPATLIDAPDQVGHEGDVERELKTENYRITRLDEVSALVMARRPHATAVKPFPASSAALRAAWVLCVLFLAVLAFLWLTATLAC